LLDNVKLLIVQLAKAEMYRQKIFRILQILGNKWYLLFQPSLGLV